MEFEERNKKPEEAAKNLPMAVLITLVGVVCLLLFVGWQMISDAPSDVGDLTPQLTLENEIEIEEVPKEASEEPSTAKTELPVVKVAKPKATKPAIAPGSTTTNHIVAKGETFFGIANRYNLTANTLRSFNDGISPEKLKVGAKLTVPIKAIHTVGPGDILRVVGGKYGVTVKALMAANGKTKNRAERGDKLIIPLKDRK